MVRYLFFFFVIASVISCKKATVGAALTEDFSKEVIYTETFDDAESWSLLPTDPGYPATNCVQIDNQLLKLRFDQSLNSCGCGWVGAEKSIANTGNFSSKKLGVRIKLSKGFFQYIMRYHYATDAYGNVHPSGTLTSNSDFRFDIPGLSMRLPNPFNGHIHEDSVFNANLNKLEGTEFELIYNEGERIFKIDGVRQSSSLVNIEPVTQAGLEDMVLQFNLGHQPELSPRLDELFIQEIEVYTWKGKLKH